MERKGWGLTVDSDPTIPFLSNSNNHRKGIMFTPVDFSANLSRSAPVDGDRKAVKELDFLSDKNMSKEAINPKMKNSHEEGPILDWAVNTALHLTTNAGSDQSTISHPSDGEDNQAKEALMAELGRVNDENKKLTSMLSQVSKDYSALQMHLMAVMQQQQQQNLGAKNTLEQEMRAKFEDKKQEGRVSDIMARQFMESNSSATTETKKNQLVPYDPHSISSSEERTHSSSQIITHNNNNSTALVVPYDPQQDKKKKGIQRETSPEYEGFVPNKIPKLSEPISVDHSTTESTMRKVRVSVRARSEAPMITDGCQWRKYGQKMAKGNPCPRAYYRCTMSLGCPVRKQVQRCAEENAILITTYEGTHNHPLPPAAMAMVSTTSAAANMLLSGSMPSADGLMNPNFLARAILPCSSNVATISASAPFPTVTLDLTHGPNPLQLQQPPTQFDVRFANLPMRNIFGQLVHNQSRFSGLQMSQEMDSARLGQNSQSHAVSGDTLSAATAAIASDPNFTAALAAAINTLMSSHQNSSNISNTTSTATTNTSGSNNKVGGGLSGN